MKFLDKLRTFAPKWSNDDFDDFACDLGDWKAEYQLGQQPKFSLFCDEHGIENFIYDRATGFILCQFSLGYHHITLGKLHCFYKTIASGGNYNAYEKLFRSFKRWEDPADGYIEDCMGFFFLVISLAGKGSLPRKTLSLPFPSV